MIKKKNPCCGREQRLYRSQRAGFVADNDSIRQNRLGVLRDRQTKVQSFPTRYSRTAGSGAPGHDGCVHGDVDSRQSPSLLQGLPGTWREGRDTTKGALAGCPVKSEFKK